MKKRLISFFLVLVFIFSMIPASISLGAATTAAQDGYSVVSGNSGEDVTKDADGTYLVSRKGTKDTIVKKGNATLDEGWITLAIPVGAAYQMRRSQGIVFGASDLTKLSTGTYYFAYLDVKNDSKNPNVRLAQITDGSATQLTGDLKLNTYLQNVEVMELDAIELSVYFTKDGVIKLYVQDICVYTTTGRTISGNKYGIKIADNVTGTNTPATASYAFKSLTTKGFGDYNLYYGGWDMGENGITSAENFNDAAVDDRSFWLAKDTHGDETVLHFSIKDYKNAVSGTSGNDTNTGIVFGVTAPSVEQNKGFYNGNSYSYYHVYLQYKTDGNAVIGLARCDKKMTGNGYDIVKDVLDCDGDQNTTENVLWDIKSFGGDYADSTGTNGDADTLSDWIQAGKDVNGFVYYNATTGNIRISLDGNRNKMINWTDPDLATRNNGNGRGYGVRANAHGVAVDVEVIDVVSHTTKGFEDVRGNWIYLEDGSAIALQSSVAYSTSKIKGNDVWYSFSATDYGCADTGFLLGAHVSDSYAGAWEDGTKGYCLFVYNNGRVCIGRFGLSYEYTDQNGNPATKTWYGLTQKDLRNKNVWMKDADSVSPEDKGVYDIKVHQVYDPATKTNTFDVYVGGHYQGTMVDSSGLGFSPAGGVYGYRSNQMGTFAAKNAEIIEYPSWLDTSVKNHQLGNFSTKRAIAYDPQTGFFRSALIDDQNIIMSNKTVTQATSGKKTVYYAVDMQKAKYGMNADDGIVFGASFSDANYNNTATWYCLVLGDQRDSNANTGRTLRLLKYTGAYQYKTDGTLESEPNTFPSVENAKSTDKTKTIGKFDYTPGDVMRIKVAVEYDLDNGVTTINGYVNGIHTFQFVDTIANEGKNDRLLSVGTHALTGTSVGVRTEASTTSWANLTVSEIDNIDDLPPAPATSDNTVVWTSLVAIVALAATAVVASKKRVKA